MWKKVLELALLVIAAIILLHLRKKENKIRKREAKREEMLLDYPDIISKMVLFLGAGMTIRNAVFQIAMDYQTMRKEGGRKRYAYEELVITCHEMESGMTELEAYERMGRRIGIPRFRTLSTLLVQHLQKGSQGLGQLLERESIDAFEERKRKARILGEQAATKLLFPMILMLLVVLVILMVPAFLSFGVGAGAMRR